MTFLNAAYEILKRVGQPLHYAEIANRALVAGMLDTRGQTPEATMGSRLYVDTKRPGSRFRRVSRGVFALAEAQPGDIGQRIESLNRKTRADLRKRLLGMPPDRFEALISELLIAIGFEEATVEVTRYSGDGGVDVRGVLNAGGVTQVNAAVQAKRWKRNVQARTVRELRGSLTAHEQGIIITTSDFSSGARKEAEEAGKTRISLVDSEGLLDLLIQHGIGVTQEQHTLLSLDEEWWGELTGEADPISSIPLPAKPAVPTVTYPLPIQATAHRQTFEAELLDADGRTRYAEVEYRSPSGAGQVASGWKSCNGWTFWRYRHSDTGEWRTIDELRGER
jgi:restriction system protein